jgi:hypothetical protein
MLKQMGESMEINAGPSGISIAHDLTLQVSFEVSATNVRNAHMIIEHH